MSQTFADTREAILNFEENMGRVDAFVNQEQGYATNTAPPVQVPSLREFMARLEGEAGSAVERAETASDEAEQARDEAVAAADSINETGMALTTLSTAAYDIAPDEWASAEFRPESNMIWFGVPRGKPGEPGASGPAGPGGSEGPQGVPGARGLTGPEGPLGAQGLKGEAGAAGPQGPKGDAGPQGVQGLQGQKGEQGEAGAPGPKGDTGVMGPQGNPGVILNVSGGLFGFEIDVDGNLLLVHDEAQTPPGLYLDSNGNLIWEGV